MAGVSGIEVRVEAIAERLDRLGDQCQAGTGCVVLGIEVPGAGPVSGRGGKAEEIKRSLPGVDGPAVVPADRIGHLSPAVEEPEHTMFVLEQEGLDAVGLGGESGAEGGGHGGAVVVPGFGSGQGEFFASGEETRLAGVEADRLGHEAFEHPGLRRPFGPVIGCPEGLAFGDGRGHVRGRSSADLGKAVLEGVAAGGVLARIGFWTSRAKRIEAIGKDLSHGGGHEKVPLGCEFKD